MNAIRTLALMSSVSVVMGLAPAAAQESRDRYRTLPIESGFLEIDREGGAVRDCRRAAANGYSCSRAAHETLERELGRLARENADMREKLAQALPGPSAGPSAKTTPSRPTPSDDELDRALGIMEKFMRRFMSIVREKDPDRT